MGSGLTKFLLALLLGASMVSAQSVTLPAPITVTQTTWLIDDIVLRVRTGVVIIRLIGDDGKARIEQVYNAGTTPTGEAIMNALNTMDLSTTCANQAARNCGSLRRRIFDRLRDDGVIAGTVQ